MAGRIAAIGLRVKLSSLRPKRAIILAASLFISRNHAASFSLLRGLCEGVTKHSDPEADSIEGGQPERVPLRDGTGRCFPFGPGGPGAQSSTHGL